MNKELFIQSSDGYLHLDDLPDNCIFNKVVTGCGGTTIALFNDINYVICVPSVELIVNKLGISNSCLSSIVGPCGQRMGVFGLFGTLLYSDRCSFQEYIESSICVKKVMCTYDKLPYVCRVLDCSQYKLLVDEYHNVLKAYSYRERAINGILDNFQLFRSVCFLSATPIESDFVPHCLQDLDLVTAKWQKTDILKVSLQQTSRPYARIGKIIKKYQEDGYLEVNGMRSYEAFFFINSVNDILKILEHCQLSKDEVRIICSNTVSNSVKLFGYGISNSLDANKRFTFITSKGFEGVDYFSESGMCFVLSNTSSKNTLVDIGTDIIQIAGRIRTQSNPFRNMLVHIFNTSGSRQLRLGVPYEQFRLEVEDEYDGLSEVVDLMNKSNSKRYTRLVKNCPYIYKKDGCYHVDDLLMKFELYNHKLQNCIYNNGITLRKSYDERGVEVSLNEFNDKDFSKPMSFKQLCLYYESLTEPLLIEKFSKDHPFIYDAYKYLGIEKIRSLRYCRPSINNAIQEYLDYSQKECQFISLLSKSFSIGFCSSSDIKRILNSIGKQVGIFKKFKSSDILDYYKCSETVIRKDGKSIRGFVIESPLFQNQPTPPTP